MNISEYAEMYKLESFYWWFVARRRLLETLVQDLPRVQPSSDSGCWVRNGHQLFSLGEIRRYL